MRVSMPHDISADGVLPCRGASILPSTLRAWMVRATSHSTRATASWASPEAHWRLLSCCHLMAPTHQPSHPWSPSGWMAA
jgi:hypothetical protein